MTQNLFTSSVTFALCELQEGQLVDTETIILRNITIDGLNHLNSYVRQTYLTAQKDAIQHWSRADQDRFLALAMKHILKLGVDTQEGNDMLFRSTEGMLHYTWVYVRDHVKDGKKIYGTLAEWEKALRSSAVAYNENMKRFNTAIIDLALLTSKEVGIDTETPQEIELDWMDHLIAALIAAGVSIDDVKSMTVEQALKVIEKKYPKLDEQKPEPVLATNDPEEFKNFLAEKLSEKTTNEQSIRRTQNQDIATDQEECPQDGDAS